MLSLDTTGRDSLFSYQPMLKWLSKRNQRLTNPGLIAVGRTTTLQSFMSSLACSVSMQMARYVGND